MVDRLSFQEAPASKERAKPARTLTRRPRASRSCTEPIFTRREAMGGWSRCGEVKGTMIAGERAGAVEA